MKIRDYIPAHTYAYRNFMYFHAAILHYFLKAIAELYNLKQILNIPDLVFYYEVKHFKINFYFDLNLNYLLKPICM